MIIQLFANTLWFLVTFKRRLILSIRERYPSAKIILIYLRPGPPIDIKMLNEFKSNNIEYISFKSKRNIIMCIRNLCRIDTKGILLTYTIGPILIGSMPIYNRFKRVATLEGLGRVFTSERIAMRILKRLVEASYRVIFNIAYQRIIVLNYVDHAYLLEHGIADWIKLKVLPGTGLDEKEYNTTTIRAENREKSLMKLKLKDTSYFSFIGRVSPEKGFFRFVSSAIYLSKYLEEEKITFLIVCPKKDIDDFSKDQIRLMSDNNMVIRPYTTNPIDYYSVSSAIVLPSMYGEGLSRVALETSFLGLPIIGFINRGLEEVVINGKNGILTSNLSPYSLAMAINTVYTEYESYRENARNHSKTLINRFGEKASNNMMMREIEDLIEEIDRPGTLPS